MWSKLPAHTTFTTKTLKILCEDRRLPPVTVSQLFKVKHKYVEGDGRRQMLNSGHFTTDMVSLSIGMHVADPAEDAALPVIE